MSKTIGLIIPCYNEAERLRPHEQAFRMANVELLFVNDGSSDGTAAWIQGLREPHSHFLNLPRNVGKAEAVRQGMLFAKTQDFYRDLKWIGFWDADLSAPLSEAEGFVRYAGAVGLLSAQVLCGSRIYKLGSRIERSAYRHGMGRLFATTAGLLFPELQSYDSQCGAKLFTPATAEKIFEKPFISRWLFDIEILLRLKDQPALECPLTLWQERAGSRLHLRRHAFEILSDLYRLRRAY